MRMRKISGRKYVIGIFPKYLAVGRKSNETIITREQRPKEMNPFQLFLIWSTSTYSQKIASQQLEHLWRFPRPSFFTFNFSLEERLNQHRACFTLFYDVFTFEGANTKTSQGKRFFHKNFSNKYSTHFSTTTWFYLLMNISIIRWI